MFDSWQAILNDILPNGSFIWLVFFSCMFTLWKLVQPAFKWCEVISEHIHQGNPGSLNRIFKGTIIAGYGIGILVLFVVVSGIWSLNMLKSAVHNAEKWEPRIQYIDDIDQDPLEHQIERLNSEETEDLLIYLSKKDETSGFFVFQVENSVPQTLSVNTHLLPAVKKYFWVIAATIVFLYLLVFAMLALIVGVVRAFWSNLETDAPKQPAESPSASVVKRVYEFERRLNNRFEGNWQVALVEAEGVSELRSVINLSIGGVKLSGGKPLPRDARVVLKNTQSDSAFAAEVLSDTVDSVRLRFIPSPLSSEEVISIIGEDASEPFGKLATT